jgi:hypothetical protein
MRTSLIVFLVVFFVSLLIYPVLKKWGIFR